MNVIRFSECRGCNNENPECKDCGGYHEWERIEDGKVVDFSYSRNRPKQEREEMFKQSMELYWNQWHYEREQAFLKAVLGDNDA